MAAPSGKLVAEVLYDYDSQEADELSMRQGDVIKHCRLVESGWFEGRLGGKAGLFPANFVKFVGPDQPEKTSIPPGRRCRVLYSYEPANDDELPLAKGDVIHILEEVEEGWWKGRLKSVIVMKSRHHGDDGLSGLEFCSHQGQACVAHLSCEVGPVVLRPDVWGLVEKIE
ncbi:unnamed protein product, partial [Cyprideis torosa]